MITVSELYIHPLKSAAAISLQHAELETLGLKNDRRWMLIDNNGQFLSQRQHPMMCLIRVNANDQQIMIELPDQVPLLATANSERKCHAVVWGDSCNAWDAGDEAAELLSTFLKTSCRLVYFPDDEIRQVDLDYALPGDRTGFSDGFPLLLISQASLDALNSKLQTAVTMTRFRPNIVVDGCEAFAEDQWQRIRVGDVTMRIVKPCSRCSIPGVNPETGERSVEVIKVLRDFRMKNDKVYFGQNVIADQNGRLKTGMSVEILD